MKGVSKLAAASLVVAFTSPLASQAPENADQSAPPFPEQPETWIVNDDYPMDSRRPEIRGATRLILAVDTTGKIYRCDIAVSSGNRRLDGLSCKLTLQRGHFIPAKDQDGTAMPSESSRTIIWWHPGDTLKERPVSSYDAFVQVQQLPQKKPYIDIVIREIIGANGNRENCVVQEGSGIAAFDRQACQLVTVLANLPPLRAPDKQTIRGMRVREITFVTKEAASGAVAELLADRLQTTPNTR